MNADFSRIVLATFKDMIRDYEFKVEIPIWWLVELTNANCILRLVYDTGVIAAQFVDPVEKAAREAVKRADGFPSGYPMHSIFDVWKALYPHDTEHFDYRGNDIEGQAKANERLIRERLTNVLKGDFSFIEPHLIPSSPPR